MNYSAWLAPTVLVASSLSAPAAETAYTVQQMIADVCTELDRVVEVVLSVKDETTAEKGVAKLTTISEAMKKIAAKSASLQEPSKEVGDALLAKFAAKIQEVQTSCNKAVPQLQAAGPKASQIFGKGMITFGAALQEVAATMQKLEAAPAAK